MRRKYENKPQGLTWNKTLYWTTYIYEIVQNISTSWRESSRNDLHKATETAENVGTKTHIATYMLQSEPTSTLKPRLGRWLESLHTDNTPSFEENRYLVDRIKLKPMSSIWESSTVSVWMSCGSTLAILIHSNCMVHKASALTRRGKKRTWLRNRTNSSKDKLTRIQKQQPSYFLSPLHRLRQSE